MEKSMNTRSDKEILRDINDEFDWEPSLRSEHIARTVKDGIVTLAGYADSYHDKWKAEQVVSRVKGVRGIANDIEVRLPTAAERPDPEVARAALDALKWNVLVPDDRIKVKVEKGWVTLEGDVNWHYQREAADRAVRRLTGVRGVTNLITVKSSPVPKDVKQQIKHAFERAASFDAEHIDVTVEDGSVILEGTVRSYAERRDAERAAYNAPGVTHVENKLRIDTNIPVPV